MIFKQNDPAWGHLPLGHGPDTIGESGCLLTAFTQILLHYGFSINPAALNADLLVGGRYINGDLLSDASISGLPQFPGVNYVTRWDFTQRAADLSVLTNNETDEYVIEIDFDHNPSDGIQTHFVRFVSYENGQLIIDDPEYGTEDNFTTHYGIDLARTILKIVKYTGPARATAAPAPAPTPPQPFSGAFDALTGTATVHSPANVRTGPGTSYPLATDHTVGGKLNVGETFAVSGELASTEAGGDPYSNGHNKWVRSQYGHWVWKQNVSLAVDAAKGGAPENPPSLDTEVADAPADTAPEVPAETVPEPPAAPAEPAEIELTDIGYTAWLKPANNDQTKKYEGAPVFDLATLKPVAVVPMETKIPFVKYKTVGGKNYFVTAHMLENNLNHGIDGPDLQQAEAPGKVVDSIQAATVAPEVAKDDTETTVKDNMPEVGPVWSKLFDFIAKHHK